MSTVTYDQDLYTWALEQAVLLKERKRIDKHLQENPGLQGKLTEGVETAGVKASMWLMKPSR